MWWKSGYMLQKLKEFLFLVLIESTGTVQTYLLNLLQVFPFFSVSF